MIDQISIRKVLIISTAHVPRHVAQWLDEQGEIAADHLSDEWPAIPSLASDKGGWTFYAQERFDDAIPTEIVAIMRKARELGATWIELGGDNDTIDGLPTWEW